MHDSRHDEDEAVIQNPRERSTLSNAQRPCERRRMEVKRFIDKTMPEVRPETPHSVRMGERSKKRGPLPRLIHAARDEYDSEEIVESRQSQDVGDELVGSHERTDGNLPACDG